MEEKRDKILRAGLELFVKQGFHGTPTSAIAKAAGVANGTLFHYFKTKEELITALFFESKLAYLDMVVAKIGEQPSLKGKIKQMFLSTVNWALECTNEYKYCSQYTHSPYVTEEVSGRLDEFYGELAAVFQSAIDKGIIKSIDIEYLFNIALGQIDAAAQYLLKHNELIGDADFYEFAFDLFWDSIKKA